MFSFIKNLFHREPEQPSALLCPHCEKSLTGHDEAACRRGMSRRFFFGLCVAPLAAKALASLPLPDFSSAELKPGDIITIEGVYQINHRNRFLMPAEIIFRPLQRFKIGETVTSGTPLFAGE